MKHNGQQDIEDTVTISVTRNSLAACSVPTITVTPGEQRARWIADRLTSPRHMHNVGSPREAAPALTCEWVIANGTRNWAPARGGFPSTRTVTVTASGSTVTGTLTLT